MPEHRVGRERAGDVETLRARRFDRRRDLLRVFLADAVRVEPRDRDRRLRESPAPHLLADQQDHAQDQVFLHHRRDLAHQHVLRDRDRAQLAGAAQEPHAFRVHVGLHADPGELERGAVDRSDHDPFGLASVDEPEAGTHPAVHRASVVGAGLPERVVAAPQRAVVEHRDRTAVDRARIAGALDLPKAHVGAGDAGRVLERVQAADEDVIADLLQRSGSERPDADLRADPRRIPDDGCDQWFGHAFSQSATAASRRAASTP